MSSQPSSKPQYQPASGTAVVSATHPENPRESGNGSRVCDDETTPATQALQWPRENPGSHTLSMNKRHLHLPEFVATKRAAEILGRSPETLKRWRYEGTGPQYVVFEGRVSYDVGVLLEYITKNTRVPSVRAAMEETREVV
jgi:hypothetical protein